MSRERSSQGARSGAGGPRGEWIRLTRELGAEPPDGLRALDEDALGDLADAIGAARRRQAAELAEGGERALAQIPRLLRGPVRKVVGA